MRNSQAPQNEEEDGWLTGEGSADEKFFVEEDYLGETPLEPHGRSSVIPRRDDRKHEESVWQDGASTPPDEEKHEEAYGSRGPAEEGKSEGLDTRHLSALVEETGEDFVSAGAHNLKNVPSHVLDTKANEKDTPRVMVNEPQLVSGEKDAEYPAEEEQRSATDRKEGVFHPPLLPLSKAATMTAGGERDQLVSAGGARSPIFLTDRNTKPLSISSSPYLPRPSSSSPVNDDDSNVRRTGNTSSSSAAKLALFDSLDNGPRIREGVDRLTSLLAGLDEKVEKLVGDHERDFLLAYRTHMYAIQQQMEYFKRKADEEQAKILRDMKVRSLEKELSWFMSEALRLDGLCKHYQSNLEKWRARAEALAEDRNFLETQIKSCKRQSRALQARVDDLQTGAADGNVDRNTLKSAFAFNENSSVKRGTCYNQNRKTVETTRASLRRVAPRVSCASGPSDLSADALRSQNERLRNELDRSKKQYKQLLFLQQTQMMSCKGEYEDFFLKCCNEVRREIQNRRVRALRLSGSPTALGKEENSDVLDENFEREATLQEFLQADRRRLLELLVSSDELLTHLHTLIFAPKGRGSPSRAAQEMRERHTE